MTPQRALKKGHQRFELGEYHKAKPLFRKARRLKSKAGRAEANFFLGECYRYLLNPRRAEVAYHHAVRYQYLDSTAILRLAQMMHINRKYAEAQGNYERFLAKTPDHEVARNGSVACASMEALMIPTEYNVQPFKIFNSSKSDFCPAFGNDKYTTVYFTTNRNGVMGDKLSGVTGSRYSDIYYSRLDARGMWTKPEAVEGEVNTKFDDGSTGFTGGGGHMYFARCAFNERVSLGGNIMVSQRTGAKWGTPQRVPIFADSIVDSVLLVHPAVSAEGEVLYFVSDMDGGYGGKDIWQVEKIGDGWSKPKNLGPAINTSDDEVFPYLRSDSVLYFSSNGHLGLGGLDIFKAVLDNEGKWKISNMGFPINSNRDDFGICFEGNSEQGFLSSNRESVRGYDDIYRFQLPVYDVSLEGMILDSRTQNPIPDALVHLVGNDGINKKVGARKSGKYIEDINVDAKYVFLASARGYLNQRGEITTEGLREDKVFTYDFNLVSMSRPVVLENVFYEFGSWELNEKAKAALDTLTLVLEDNPNVCMEISSHTDMVGDSLFNMDLSQKRAQGVVDYLISKGIDAERLSAKGYGEEVPVVVTEVMEKEYRFIYKGEVLNEALISELTPKQVELVNQINRRTEFKVTKTNYKKTE